MAWKTQGSLRAVHRADVVASLELGLRVIFASMASWGSSVRLSLTVVTAITLALVIRPPERDELTASSPIPSVAAT